MRKRKSDPAIRMVTLTDEVPGSTESMEDERVKCLLIGFGMGLGFGFGIYTGIKTSDSQAPMGCILENKSIICEDQKSSVIPSDGTDFSEEICFENHDIKDIISDRSENVDRQENSDSPCDSTDIKDIISESPLMMSSLKKESFEKTEHLSVDESHNEKEIGQNSLECVNCLTTFKERKAFNRHQRVMFDCRLNKICKEPHNHDYTLRKFSSLEEAKAYCATLGKCQSNSGHSGTDSKDKSYCRNRKRFGCKASWSLKKNGLGDFAFTGCLKHVDSCLEMGDKRLATGRKPKPRGEVRKRIRTKLKCDKCDFKGVSLKLHIKSVHDKIKDNVCQECGYACSEKNTLDNHIKSVHLKLKDYVCEECGSAFFSNAKLQLHKQSVHLNMRNYICEQCGKAYNTKEGLKMHKNVVHLKIKKFVCQCGYATALSGNLKKHKATVHKV